MGRKKIKKKLNAGNSEQLIIINKKFQEGVTFHQKGMFQDALNNYNEVLGMMPEHEDSLYLSGVLLHQTGNDQKAVDLIERAISYNPSKQEYYGTLVKAYNNLGLFYQEQGDIQKAFDSYHKSLEIDPDFKLALNNVGLIYKDKKDYLNAEKCYRKAIAVDSLFYEACFYLGNVFQDQKLFEEALEYYDKVLKINSSSWQAHNNIGSILKFQGKLDSSKKHFIKAIELNPEYGEAYYNLGCVCYEEGDHDEAIRHYIKCIEINPDYVQAYSNAGNVFLEKKMYKDAEACYLKALDIDSDFAEAYNNVGNLYQIQNDHNKAVNNLEKAVKLAPEIPEFQTNLGIAYRKFGDLKKAADCFRQAIELIPDYAEPYYNLGEANKDLSRFSEAISCYEKVLKLNSKFEDVYDPLAYSYQRICSWDKSKKYQKKVEELTDRAIEVDAPITEIPHNCLIRRDDPLTCYRVAKSWSDKISVEIESGNEQFFFGEKRKENKKIRIGYFSNTFRDHPGGHLIAGLFGCHNRSEFQIFSYSYGSNDGSYYRKKVEAESDKFFDIRGLNDIEAAKCIYNDKIDILVDLRGFTMSSRPTICALRPAPVQIVYLGFPGSSGADFYDYLIADKTVVPEEHLKYFSENIVYMPDCYQVNNNDQEISSEVITRKDAGLPENDFVFCSFNTEYKIEPVMFDCWMRILKRVPQSVLWLLKTGDEMVKNLIKEAELRGVDSSRLVFARRMAKDKHLARNRLADLALDTRIVNGHTTTSDSLWAGVPVISMPGNHFSSRVSASILKAAGLPELVVDTLDDYENLAVELGTNEDKLKKLKIKVERNKKTESLFNTQLFASNIEKSYKIMWDRFKNDSPHDLIEI